MIENPQYRNGNNVLIFRYLLSGALTSTKVIPMGIFDRRQFARIIKPVTAFIFAKAVLQISPMYAQTVAGGSPEAPVIPAPAERAFDRYDGIVTNQVITVAGQDFYQFFVAAWREKEGSDRYALAVHERPSARWGSEVWVEFRQQRVFRTFLPAARAAIRPISEQAADIAYRSVAQMAAQNLLVNDTDLGHDEI
jgi:curli production assembly/transport component CsgE